MGFRPLTNYVLDYAIRRSIHFKRESEPLRIRSCDRRKLTTLVAKNDEAETGFRVRLCAPHHLLDGTTDPTQAVLLCSLVHLCSASVAALDDSPSSLAQVP